MPGLSLGLGSVLSQETHTPQGQRGARAALGRHLHWDKDPRQSFPPQAPELGPGPSCTLARGQPGEVCCSSERDISGCPLQLGLSAWVDVCPRGVTVVRKRVWTRRKGDHPEPLPACLFRYRPSREVGTLHENPPRLRAHGLQRRLHLPYVPPAGLALQCERSCSEVLLLAA